MAASTRTAWYPRVGFPFQGTTNLTVEGLWLERPSDRAFVVHRIVSCTHPFPFTHLYYLTDVTTTTSLTKVATATTREGDPHPVRKGFRLRTGSRDATLVSASITMAVNDDAVAFPDLSGKRVVRVKPTANRGMPGRPKPAEGGEDPMELGVGGHEKGSLRGAHVAQKGLPSETIVEPPELLQKAVQAARQFSENLRTVSPSGKPGTSRMETCSDDGQKVGFWVSRFDFYRGGMALGSRLVLEAEESVGTNRPALPMFEAPEDASRSADAWTDMAIVFWADDERRQEVARRYRLCGHWTAAGLAGQDSDVILTSLLEQVGVGLEVHGAADVAPAADFLSLQGTCAARLTLPEALAKVLELPWRVPSGLSQ